MSRCRLVLASLVGLILSALPAGAAPAPAASWTTVVGVRQISRDTLRPVLPRCQKDTEVEPHVAVDPNDSRVVVATFQVGRCEGGAEGIGYATSHDGGRTWSSGVLRGLTVLTGGRYNRGSDPSVAFGPDGMVYVADMGFENPGCHSAVAVQRSHDGGLTFEPPVFVFRRGCSDFAFSDKPWIAVDAGPRSPHAGRVYVAWTLLERRTEMVLSHSDDEGATWSRAALVRGTFGQGAEGALPVVQPHGALTIVYRADYPTGPVLAKTSHDGGATFGHAVQVSTVHDHLPPDLRVGALPAATVDPSTGVIFATWMDGRSLRSS